MANGGVRVIANDLEGAPSLGAAECDREFGSEGCGDLDVGVFSLSAFGGRRRPPGPANGVVRGSRLTWRASGPTPPLIRDDF